MHSHSTLLAPGVLASPLSCELAGEFCGVFAGDFLLMDLVFLSLILDGVRLGNGLALEAPEPVLTSAPFAAEGGVAATRFRSGVRDEEIV